MNLCVKTALRPWNVFEWNASWTKKKTHRSKIYHLFFLLNISYLSNDFNKLFFWTVLVTYTLVLFSDDTKVDCFRRCSFLCFSNCLFLLCFKCRIKWNSDLLDGTSFILVLVGFVIWIGMWLNVSTFWYFHVIFFRLIFRWFIFGNTINNAQSLIIIKSVIKVKK